MIFLVILFVFLHPVHKFGLIFSVKREEEESAIAKNRIMRLDVRVLNKVVI